MNEIAIYGAGGFGREIALVIEQINQVEKTWNLLGFYDDGLEKGTEVDGITILGGLEDANGLMNQSAMIVAVADPEARAEIVSSITNERIYFPVIAHPHANLGSELNWFGKGSIITAGCIITTGVVLGEFTILNLASTLGHDVKVGSFSSIMPGCNISGNIQIGERTMIGTGARLLQNITIGKACKIGAGAVVTKSFGDNLTLVGVPAKVVKSGKSVKSGSQ